MTAEHRRLEEARERVRPLEEVGAVPQRAAVGHGPRGLQRGRRRLGLLQPRPGPLARLPLGRGRPGRHLRRPAAALLRPGPVERQGPDPQGAPVRPDQQREQPRRGRQGVLLLPRQHADALVHEVPLQVSAGGVPLRRPRRDQPAAGAAASSSTSCSTPASSTRTATSTCSSSTPRQSPEDILIQITVHNRGPEPAELHVLPTLWFRNQWSWHGERRPAGAAAGRRRPRARASSRPSTPSSASATSTATATSRCCSPRTRPTRSGSSASPTARPYVKDGINNYVVHGQQGRGEPGEDGHEGRGPLPPHRRARRVAR